MITRSKYLCSVKNEAMRGIIVPTIWEWVRFGDPTLKEEVEVGGKFVCESSRGSRIPFTTTIPKKESSKMGD